MELTAQGVLPAAGADVAAAPVTDTFNHIMNTINGNNIDENNVDFTSADGIGTLQNAQTFTGQKTFSSFILTGRVAGNANNFLIGGYDGIVSATNGDYTTIQAADDALDAADGYRLFVNGGQTYAETVTVSTNDNVIVLGPKTVVTSLVLSGARNHVVAEPGFQCTGALTLSGANNVLIIQGAANLDGAVSITGDDSIIEVGPESNLATTLSLDTATGQIFRAGNETQIVGNITVSSGNAELHMGSTANIDGTVTFSGSHSRIFLGDSANLAQTLTIGGGATRNEFYIGNESTITGAVDMQGSIGIFKMGYNGTLSSTFTVSAGTDQTVEFGSHTQIVGNVTISAGGVRFTAGTAWDFDGTLDIDGGGDQCKMTLGANGNLAGAMTITGSECDVYIGSGSVLASTFDTTSGGKTLVECGHNVQIVGNLAVAGSYSGLKMGLGANIDGTVTLTSTGCFLDCGNNANLASTLLLGSSASNQWFRVGAVSTITGAITVSDGACKLEFGSQCTITGAVTLNSGAPDGSIRAGAKCNFDGIVTLGGVGCSLICENGCDLDGIVLSGTEGFIDGGGWDTTVDGTTANHAISITAGEFLVQNLTALTTAGGTQPYDGINTTGATTGFIKNINFSASDNNNLTLAGATNARIHIEGCHFSNPDADAINSVSPLCFYLNNWFNTNIDGEVFNIGSTGDNWLIANNIIEDAGAAIAINADAENGLFMANVYNGTLTDGSGSSTVPASGTGNENY